MFKPEQIYEEDESGRLDEHEDFIGDYDGTGSPPDGEVTAGCLFWYSNLEQYD